MIRTKLSHLYLIIKSHIRLYISILIGVIFAFLSPFFNLNPLTQAIIGYNIGAFIYIVLAMQLILTSNEEKMLKRALSHDDGKFVVMVLIIMALLFSVISIFSDLVSIKHLEGAEKKAHLLLSLSTIVYCIP